jgi:tRNA G18 (ribose-2'-O)-methylase SpoU
MQKLSMEALQRKSLHEIKQTEKIPVVAVLENIRSAYNVGSLFRTSDAFLLQSIYLTGYTAIPPHKEIKKTALGAEESVEWHYFTNAIEAVLHLKESGFTVYAVEQVNKSILLNKMKFDPTDKIAVVFGNEVSGIENETLFHCDGCIEIPQFGIKHSLNVASAAAVVLWEIVRTRLNKI